MDFEDWFQTIEERIKKDFPDIDIETTKFHMKYAFHNGQDDGVMEAYRDIKNVMAAIKRSLEVPVDDKRIDEMWDTYLSDPNPEGDITVGTLKKGPINLISSGSGGKSVYWAANEEAPLTRDQQIDLMVNAKERHKHFVERATKISKEENKNGNY